MNSKQFEQCFESRVELCRRVLVGKNVDYARDGDKLHNFQAAAEMEGTTPEQALRGMLLKHWQSLRDMTNDMDKGMSLPMDMWEEKIGDALNYLFLLRALVEERRGDTPFKDAKWGYVAREALVEERRGDTPFKDAKWGYVAREALKEAGNDSC